MAQEKPIKIINAYENNLKNINVEIPKKQITVFTGVSGSGKSSLCFDTIASVSRRELNETFPSFVQQFLPKYGRPHVEKIENLPVTIILDQKKPTANSRSTVGTYTDIYALLRLLFSRVGEPFVGFSDYFSFNHPKGKCERCDGLGEVTDLDIHKLVDFNKCLNDEDVIHFPAFTTGAWRWKRYAYSGLFDLNKKIRDYTKEELDLFLYSPQIKLKNPPKLWPKSAKYEGIYPRMYRSIIHSQEGKRHQKTLDKMVTTQVCPVCHGSRVNEMIRSCKINDKNIADLTSFPIPKLIKFVHTINHPLSIDLKKELIKRLQALVDIGLGYLSLDRGISTLSGGEAQRIKIAKYINSSLTDLVYLLDEPSVGLHPYDIQLLKESIIKLKQQGNTILIVEHNKEIIQMADFIVDMGPKSGIHGGEICFKGTFRGLLQSDTITGKLFHQNKKVKEETRIPSSWFTIKNATLHNLKDITVKFPLGVMTAVIGVAGSGKSSLMEVFQKAYPHEVIYIDQKDIGANSRSTPATYLNILDEIRMLFSEANKVSSSYFSYNSKGACPACSGKGIIVSEMAFMESIETECDVCHGHRYSKEVLEYTYQGKTIAEVLNFTVDEAIGFFKDHSFIKQLISLEKVGLGYLHLNQSMSTLSGGELQRVKLASQLYKKGSLMILDEPTDGLHLADVNKLMVLFHELVDASNTLILIVHSLDVIKEVDYVIELGPKAGVLGGQVLFSGTPKELLQEQNSVTRPYLLKSLGEHNESV